MAWNGTVAAIVAALTVSLATLSVAPLEPRIALGPSRLDQTETVWVIFHAKAGKEETLRELLRESWALYVRKAMVLAQPHIVGEGDEQGGTYFLEVLTWKSADVPDNADAEVRAQWKKLEDACTPRRGESGIVFREIELVR